MTAEEGDIAIVTTRSGYRYVGVYTLAPGIDYFWASAIKDDHKANNQLVDPDESFEVIGKSIK